MSEWIIKHHMPSQMSESVGILICSYLNFPYRKNIKTAKYGGFCEELLSENEFEAVLVNFCCYEYIIVPMLLRQFRSED